MSKRNTPNDIAPVISSVLQVGVISSTLIILTGLVLFFIQASPHGVSYRRYTAPGYSFPHSIPAIMDTVRTRQGAGLIELGILFLILTPITRVAASVFIFLRQHDKPMTLVTLFVLLVLASSFLLGITVR